MCVGADMVEGRRDVSGGGGCFVAAVVGEMDF